MATLVEPPSTPTEVLIPEARRHQRRRHVRTAVAVTLAGALLVGLLVAGVIMLGDAAGGKPKTAATGATSSVRVSGPVYFRPVLCAAYPYDPAPAGTTTGRPACSAASQLTVQNLRVQPISTTPAGYSSNNVPPDPALAGVPSTTPAADKPGATVLLPQLGPPGNTQQRYVLGPAEMTSAAVKSVSVTKNRYGAWLVNFTVRSGALWDKVTQHSFHQLIGIDLDGVVYSAPIIQPTRSSFSSFDGKGVISGSLTKADADRLAHAMQPHPR